MKVLVACESSGRVRDAFRRRGHDSLSCDLKKSEVGGPHYTGNVLDIIDEGWDLMVGHPPCTRLANSGVHWLSRRDLWADLDEAAAFFRALMNANIPLVAIENPIPHKYAVQRIGRKYDQIIQPWQFGHPESKATCLWLRGLPPLTPTNVIAKPHCGYWDNQTPSGQNKIGPGPDRATIRSRTYQGIAEAMADQWTPNEA